MADERTSSVPTGDQAIPSAEVSPTAAHQPAAGADARRQKSWVWFAAILAAVVAFVVPYLLLNSGKQREEPERRAPETATNKAQATDPIRDALDSIFNPSATNALPEVSEVPVGSRSSPMPADELFRRVSPAVVQVHSHDRQGRHTSSGSGFLVNKNGLIVTNYHVIKNAHSVKVVLANDKHLAVAGAAAFDEEADIAILSVPFQFSAEPLDLAEEGLPVGAKVYAIGSPRGLSNSMSDGIVSGYREIDRKKMVQTTAPISPGSSGGPLVGTNGQVVGVTTLARKDSQNLNFAVPASIIAKHLLAADRGAKLTGFPLVQAPSAEERVQLPDTSDRQSRNNKHVQEIAGAIKALDEVIVGWAESEWRTFTNPYRLGKMSDESTRDSFFEFLIKLEMNEKSRLKSIERGAASKGMTIDEYAREKRLFFPEDHGTGNWKKLRDNLRELDYR